MNAKMLTFDKIHITGGFWASRQEIIRETTIWNVYNRFKETDRSRLSSLTGKKATCESG